MLRICARRVDARDGCAEVRGGIVPELGHQRMTFEQGTGTEVFTFEMDGDKAVLVGYKINSKELILK